jgi:hypothetical protein
MVYVIPDSFATYVPHLSAQHGYGAPNEASAAATSSSSQPTVPSVHRQARGGGHSNGPVANGHYSPPAAVRIPIPGGGEAQVRPANGTVGIPIEDDDGKHHGSSSSSSIRYPKEMLKTLAAFFFMVINMVRISS